MKIDERKKLEEILEKVGKLKKYLDEVELNIENDSLSDVFYKANQMKSILGNFNNDISYLACLLVKEYLCSMHNMKESFDVSIKPQSAPGLDIDELTYTGERIIGEIKTTLSYGNNDLGSKQKESFLHDFEKLNSNSASYKYFFVTEQKTFNIIEKKYSEYLNNINLVFINTQSGLIESKHIQEYNINSKSATDDLSDMNDNKFKLSDQIRLEIYNEVVKNHELTGSKRIEIESSKIHSNLCLERHYPAVCSAMSGKKIEQSFNLKIIKVDGKIGSKYRVIYQIT